MQQEDWLCDDCKTGNHVVVYRCAKGWCCVSCLERQKSQSNYRIRQRLHHLAAPHDAEGDKP